MNSFIDDNFNPPQRFIEIVSKTAVIQWELNTGKVVLLSGLDEIPSILLKNGANFNSDIINIQDIIDISVHNIIWEKTAPFFNQRQNRISKNYLIQFSLNHNYGLDESYIVNVILKNGENLLKMVITHTGALKNINDNLILIHEQKDDCEDQIVFATSIKSEFKVDLINYEYQILQLLSYGYGSKTIGNLLHLSKYTVDDYRKSMLEKFKASNTLQLIKHAYQEGFF